MPVTVRSPIALTLFLSIQSFLLVLARPSAAASANGAFISCLTAISGKPELSLPGFQNYGLVSNGIRLPRMQRPAAVIFPDTIPQVQAAVLCAVRHNLDPIPRSGGCSFEGLSTADGALVIDLTNMAAVVVDVPGMTARVQTGIRMGKLYTDVFNAGNAVGRNLSCLGGVWPQIGFGGLMAAGGYGSMSRAYGVLTDHVIAAKVVDAKGRLLDASPTVNPDLFFAIRGGGGGTYGIVVEAKIKLIEVPLVTVGVLAYPSLDSAVEIMDRFQNWAPKATPKLTFTFNIVQSKLDMKFYYLGPAKELRSIILEESGLAKYTGATYQAVECGSLDSRWWLVNSAKPMACGKGISVSQRLDTTLLAGKEASKYAAAYFRKPIPVAGLQELVDIVASPVAKNWRLLQFKAYGGAFDQFADDFNAFPHRKGVLMHLEYGVAIGSRPPGFIERGYDGAKVAALQWYQQARTILAKYESGEKYNGYISLDDSVASYFGPNFQRLRSIKKKYDPENVFQTLASVPPAKH